MFAVGVFFNYNYTIWQFFADLIFVDFQKIAKSAKKQNPAKKGVLQLDEIICLKTFLIHVIKVFQFPNQ